MPYNKSLKKQIAITMFKSDLENLETLVQTLNKEGISCTKSDVLTQAFRDYLKLILSTGKKIQDGQEQRDKEVIKDA